MAEFTKGSWKVEINEKSGRASIVGPLGNGAVRASDGLGYLFYVDLSTLATADVVMFPDIDPEKLVIARLAAAAPDMFEALKEARRITLETAEITGWYRPALIAQIDAALSRATGA